MTQFTVHVQGKNISKTEKVEAFSHEEALKQVATKYPELRVTSILKS